jgi:hypothetical protein
MWRTALGITVRSTLPNARGVETTDVFGRVMDLEAFPDAAAFDDAERKVRRRLSV